MLIRCMISPPNLERVRILLLFLLLSFLWSYWRLTVLAFPTRRNGAWGRGNLEADFANHTRRDLMTKQRLIKSLLFIVDFSSAAGFYPATSFYKASACDDATALPSLLSSTAFYEAFLLWVMLLNLCLSSSLNTDNLKSTNISDIALSR